MLALRVPRAVAALLLCAIALLATGTGRARAGTWTLVSCSQPSGQPAPTDGWTTGLWAGAVTAYSGDSNTCAQPGGALTAESSAAGPAASYTGPEWIFTAPAGSTVAGGSVSASLTSPQGQTWIGTPGPAYDGADVIANCGLNESCGANGTLSGTFPITHPGGTAIYAPAICVDFTSSACPQTGPTPNAEVSITRAEVELSVPAAPEGEDFRGGLLDRGARGTADLVFNAVDSVVGGGFGPGIYRVSATIDGRTVESGVPDLGGGACVPLGTDPATGGLMFDRAQPCPAEASLTIPVSTAPLSDGRHGLKVTLSDAAGDVATVLSRTITTSNPITSPRPIRPFEVGARLTMGWVFTGPRTRLDSARAADLPATGTITVACSGPRCPRLALRSVSAAHVGRLWSELKHATLHAGDRLELTIRASHRRPEPIQFHIRSGRPPTARLLRSR